MQILKRLRDAMTDRAFDAVLITKPENKRYISGFTGTSGIAVVSHENAWFITDFRYKDQAAAECKGFEIKLHTPEKSIYDVLNELNLKSLAFEDESMTVKEFDTYRENMPNTAFTPIDQLIESLRLQKSKAEIETIKKSASIADAAFEHILTYIKPGMAEKEVALELEMFMKKQGASALSFDIIVASGWRSSLPHGRASDKIIENGDFVTMDFGCVYKGYCSDMTRTIVMGQATEKQRKVYETVLKAQEAALQYIKPGIQGKDADKIARDIITEEGFGEYFGHGLGHGVGLEVHEAPRLAPIGEKILEKNMVVTDEPGIYIPEFGGVRIEDLIVVTENGCERLSTSPKHLIEL
ncbi:M24 family metallopeptidase [Fusibacter sp. JL216-2]|uniref:M24 family metallopeptidase n=1 Tax=Fusibacter sp. JL216-2 TaxID=3071453 RepID=UPI003D35160F